MSNWSVHVVNQVFANFFFKKRVYCKGSYNVHCNWLIWEWCSLQNMYFLCTVAQLSLLAVLINGGCYWIASHDVAFWCNITLSCYTQSTLFAIFGLHLHSIIYVKWLFVSCKVTFIQHVNPLNLPITSQKYYLTSFCSSEECVKLKKYIILLWITKFVE